MEVLWWLAPPAAMTCVAMVWAAWLGRQREQGQRDDSQAALARMETALARPAPRRSLRHVQPPAAVEPSHGVAVRGTARRPVSRPPTAR